MGAPSARPGHDHEPETLADAICDGATWRWNRVSDTFEVTAPSSEAGVILRSAPLSELVAVISEVDVWRLRRAMRVILEDVSDEFTICTETATADTPRTLILRGRRQLDSGEAQIVGSIALPDSTTVSSAQGVLDALAGNVAVLDATGRIVAVNEAWRAFARGGGVEREWLGDDYLAPCLAAARDDPIAERVASGIRELLAGDRDTLEVEYPCHHGHLERWFHLRTVATRAAGERLLVVHHTDISALTRARTDARRARRTLHQAQAAANIGSFEQHADGRVEVTPTLLALLGRSEILRLEEIISAFPPSERAHLAQGLSAVQTGAAWTRAHTLGDRAVSVQLTPILTDGRVRGVCGVVQPETADEVRALREVVEHLRECVCSVDATGRISDVNGAGCELLQYSREELIGRNLLDAIAVEDGEQLSEDLRGWMVGGGQASPDGPREGVFVRRDGVAIPVSLARMPRENGVATATFVFTDISQRKQEEQRRAEQLARGKWTRRVLRALQDDRFVLYAQPIVDIERGEVVQHELLIRMLDDDGKVLGPASFLAAAEHSGLIRDVDLWVAKQASALALRGHTVHLNLSAASLCDSGTTRAIEQAIVSSGADPRRIVVELTETAVLSDERAARAFARRLADLGVGIALDDFGTGYGGFTYLKLLPVSYLKIDREFVRDLPGSTASLNVVEATVQLARSFGIRTIAEGIESSAAWEVLRACGVDLAQGYLFSRPKPITGLS